MSRIRPRTQRMQDGADDNDPGYGNMGDLSKRLSESLKRRGAEVTQRDWAEMTAKGKKPRT